MKKSNKTIQLCVFFLAIMCSVAFLMHALPSSSIVFNKVPLEKISFKTSFLNKIVSNNTNSISLNLSEIGKRIWRNECAGKVEGLTHWGEGEDFPSFGIGHFIWFPKNRKKIIFTEQFPDLRDFLADNGHSLPPYFHGACPWQTRNEFLAAFNSNLMRSLRSFLAKTVDLQTRFIIERFKKAIPFMLSHVPVKRRAQVRSQLYRVGRAPMGMYALIDYVNFKGEGIGISERYQGKPWGLLQVLERMQGTAEGKNALHEFARCAKEVLAERVRNAPPARNESRWLPGWYNRIDTYTQ